MKRVSKKPLSKSLERNRRVQFNLHIGQAKEDNFHGQQAIPETMASVADLSTNDWNEGYDRYGERAQSLLIV